MIVPPRNMDTFKSCFHCKHYRTEYTHHDGEIEYDVMNCVAFPYPDGIPSKIYHNGHFEPRPDLGQKNEVVFEPNEELIQRLKKRHTKKVVDSNSSAFAEGK